MNNLVFGNAERKPAVLPAPAVVAVAAVVISWQTTVKGLFMEEKCPNCRERKQVKIEDEDEDEDHKKEKEQSVEQKLTTKELIAKAFLVKVKQVRKNEEQDYKTGRYAA